MKYLVTIQYATKVKAINENEAINQVFEDLESESNMSITNTLRQYHSRAVLVNSGPTKKNTRCWAQVGTHWCGNKISKGYYCKKHQYFAD